MVFVQYGIAVAPALFINKELVLYGGVPSVEKLVEVIEKNAEKSELLLSAKRLYEIALREEVYYVDPKTCRLRNS